MNLRSKTACNFILALCASMASTLVQAEAGRVESLSGAASVLRNQQRVGLAEGAAIESGDQLQTGADGTLTVRMVNGEEISLRPNTRFTIDRFRAPASEAKPETGRSFYTLLKGGLRAITRSLGRRGLDSYRINTPVATIGVRGSTIIVAHDPALGSGLGVEEGGAFMKNAQGTVEVEADGFAASSGRGVAPRASATMPAVLINAGFGPADSGRQRPERPETAERPLRIERPEPTPTTETPVERVDPPVIIENPRD